MLQANLSDKKIFYPIDESWVLKDITQDSFYRTQRMRIIILITQDSVRVFIVDTFVKPDTSDGPVGVRLVYRFHWYLFFL